MPAPDDTSADSTEPPPSPTEPASSTPPLQVAWPWVLCLIGLDYLSTLAYQPSIAFGAAGKLAPLATVLVAAATLLLALPLYWYIAGRSPHGGGSAALLERIVPGWFGKFLVLVLLAFGAVDLVFTRTFSASSAAEHLIHSPHPDWQRGLDNATREGEQLRRQLPDGVRGATEGYWNRPTVVTLVVLTLGTVIGLIFFRGYSRNFVRVAVLTVGVYLTLTLVVVVSGAVYLAGHSQLVEAWWADVWAGNWKPGAAARPVADWTTLAAVCVPLFPFLALGLSGFELTLMSMPLIRGKPGDAHEKPRGRIRNTRLLLTVAAVTMSAYLLGSTLVTTVLIPAPALTADGQAKYRALAYLAHDGRLSDGAAASAMCPLFGLPFGTAYDVSTVAILALAGLSVGMTLSAWVPPYLHRLGMEFDWSVRLGALMYLLLAVKFGVILYYKADLDAQRGAYLTSVLAVFAFAAWTAVIDVHHKRTRLGWRKAFRVSPLFLLALLVFAGSGLYITWLRPAAAVLAGSFVVVILGVSVVSRAWRTTELRFAGFVFADKASEYEWARLKASDYPILVPIRSGGEPLREKEIAIRTRHRLPGTVPIMFVQAELADPSEFTHPAKVRIAREDGRFVIHVTRCVSIPHAVAALALELSSEGAVPEVHFGWSAENPVTANLHFVLFGHGNVPWMVYTLIRRANVPEDRKPRVIVG